MDITGSTNIKSFNKGQSYKGLRENHFDNEDRLEKGISKDSELEELNKHYRFYPLSYESREKQIQEYNNKPSQRKNKSRQYADLSDYVEKKRQHKRVNKDFHGLEYMMVSKVGSMESWESVVNQFKEHGVSEKETLECLNGAFHQYCMDFNETYGKHGLYIIEADTNLDEMGSPHIHSRVALVRNLKNGLPDTNLANALKSAYGKANNKELMERFRLDLDNSLIDLSSQALVELSHEKGFDFEGLGLIRTKAEEKGLTHNAYIERQELKREQERVQSQAKKLMLKEQSLLVREDKLKDKEDELEDREIKLNRREDNIKATEASISSSKALLDQREVEVALREEEALKTQNMASEKLREAEEREEEAKELLQDAKILNKGFPEYLKSKTKAGHDFIDKVVSDYKSIETRRSRLLQQGDTHLKQQKQNDRQLGD